LRHELSITGAAARVGAATREESGALKPEAAERRESIVCLGDTIEVQLGAGKARHKIALANNFGPRF